MKSFRFCFFFIVSYNFLFSQGIGLPIFQKEVLILQSYERDYMHSREIEQGIENYFENSGKNIRFRYEFLDTKNFFSEKYLDSMAEILSEKYHNIPLDGVILCDDDALKLYLKYKDQLFMENVPIIATGINSLEGYPLEIPNLCIIEEKPNIEKNIQLALKQNRNINTFHFVYDTTTTSTQMYNEITKLLSFKYPEYKVFHHNSLFPEEIKTLINSGTENELFFFVLYSRDSNGTPYHYTEVPLYAIQNAKNPVYVFWEFYMGTGVIGGHVASSNLYGSVAANILNQFWETTILPPVVPESGERQKYVLDYNVLKRYGISYIPDSSEILNKPISYFEKNKTLILIFLGIIGILSIVILLLLYGLRQKKNAVRNHQKITQLNLEIIETQKDLITRLGDVIETRSHETASHVKRVASVSVFIAKEYGLNPHEIDILSTISPMHDVGKIGISENILHKPGKLSPEEFEIMKYHTQIGYELLKNSNKEMMHYASIVALEHHERWDGTGYPDGKMGRQIHVLSRITGIADVYDALRSDRIYKKSWPIEKTLSYLSQEKGKFFEPALVDIVLSHSKEIEILREKATQEGFSEFGEVYHYLEETASIPHQ